MMPGDDDRLPELCSAVADGRTVDWPARLAAATNDRERGLIAQLQVLERVRSGGRTDPVDHQRWGSLEVLEELGRGANGRVYRARDPRLDREVALKLFAGEAVSEARFLREAQILARIRHPHIVAVYGADVFGGASGIWMELVRGRSLEAVVREQGSFGAREAALVGIDLCAALASVHGAGLCHRDIKAHNVMREVGGRIVLMDFGAGRPSHGVEDTTDASVTGTPAYMAPELFTGATASVVTDLYALGVLLFYLVTGNYPVAGATVADLRDAHGRGLRRRLREARADTPALFAQAVDRALDPDPGSRFLSAAAMEQALTSTLQVVHPLPESRRATGWRTAVARPLPAWAMVGALAIAIPAAYIIGGGRANQSNQRGAAATGEQVPPWGIPGSPSPLSTEHWDTIEDKQELAGILADRGDWVGAVEQYKKAYQVLVSQNWHDEPFWAHVDGKLGWAQLRAGQLNEASDTLSADLYTLQQEGGVFHPLRATILMATADLQYQRGDRSAAAASVIEAIRVRQGGLKAAGCGVASTALPEVNRLAAVLTHGPPSQDDDGDWIPDAIERVVGLDPTTVDSNGNGVTDDDEDSRGDGVHNGLVWAIVPDAARVLTQFGNVDPERSGYRRIRPFVGKPATLAGGVPAWHITTPVQGFYFQRLTSSQKQHAMTRGWRLLSCGANWSGANGVDVDLTPLGPRYDQNFLIDANGRSALTLSTNVIPRAGEIVDFERPAGPWPGTEYVFRPGRGAQLRAGRFHREGYAGHRQFQEDFGLFFGASNDIGAARQGEIDYSLILLQIR